MSQSLDGVSLSRTPQSVSQRDREATRQQGNPQDRGGLPATAMRCRAGAGAGCQKLGASSGCALAEFSARHPGPVPGPANLHWPPHGPLPSQKLPSQPFARPDK